MTNLTQKQDLKNIYTPDQLQEALFHAVDILDRAICPFLLLKETARSIVEEDSLQGDGIYLGVRQNELTESTLSMLRTMASNVDINLGMNDYLKDEKSLSWKFKGIPISIKIIHRRYPMFDNPNYVFYWGEQYSIPNPFSKYWKVRNLIK